MSKKTVFIKRYGSPGILDTAQHGTFCLVQNELDLDVYVQTNKDTEAPKWIVMGTYSKDCNINKIKKEAEKFKLLKF